MNAIVTLFPHLDADAGFSLQQEAGDRLRAIYTAGIPERHRSAGFAEPYTGRKIVCIDNRVVQDRKGFGTYMIGIDYAMAMSRGLIVHRTMARTNRRERRHHIQNALRIRDALCWWGLSAHRRS
jgi:hypothetical protein